MKLSNILVACLFISVSTGCATSNQNNKLHSEVSPRQLSNLTTEKQKQYVNAKLLAESALKQRQFNIASTNYLIAARIINSTEFAKKAVHLAERSEDYIASLQAAHFWAEIAPKNQSALAWKILGLLRSHQNIPLQKNLKNLLKITQNSPTGQFLLVMETVISKSANKASFDAIQLFANKNPKEVEIWLVLARLAEVIDEKVTALSLINKALQIKPQSLLALEMKGHFYLRDGKFALAKQHFEKSVQENPQENNLKLQLAKIFYQEANYKNAEILSLKILDSKPELVTARYLLAAIYFAQEMFSESEEHFLMLLEKKYKSDSVYYFLGEINLSYEKKNIALQFFDAVSSGIHLTSSRVNAASILFEQGKLEEALKKLRNVRVNAPREQIYLAITEIEMLTKSDAIEQYRIEIEQSFNRNPTNIFLFTRALKITNTPLQREQIVNTSLNLAQSPQSYKALVEVAFSIISQLGDNTQAIGLLNEYLKQFPRDFQLLYSRAMLKAAIGDISGMDKDLQKILDFDANYIDALNALGYSLADQNKELDRAYKMISEAFLKRPNSGAITDSMGWILYRKGELKSSLMHLLKAWSIEPSAEVAAHLGEVLWFLDKKEKASEIWQQAIELDESNTILLETMLRLNGK